ncbi:MAG: hypothetical protein H6Q88_1284, partial [Anaeromyxobacteraceae bacterium]|nr:hypothetical protein [Anaeromyxobacteraceae bacterium]
MPVPPEIPVGYRADSGDLLLGRRFRSGIATPGRYDGRTCP